MLGEVWVGRDESLGEGVCAGKRRDLEQKKKDSELVGCYEIHRGWGEALPGLIIPPNGRCILGMPELSIRSFRACRC